MENADYKKMYFKLFNVLTDAAEAIEKGEVLRAYGIICRAQQDAEDIYIEEGSEIE